jgi:cation diffusion facilitator CzcD-associated flavoprotein CzcO
MKRLIIIGAGPVGLEAALLGVERGFEVTVLEKEEVGSALRRWGNTPLFTPVEMNLSPRARALLPEPPAPDALLTGNETIERLLEPLARSRPLASRVHRRHRVIAVGRARMGRGELAGHPVRGERAFRLLVETPTGERFFEADRVLDASGVYDSPANVGAGGLPARGERQLGDRMIRHLGVLEARRAELAGRRILLVGHGHSAAHALILLRDLHAEAPKTQVIHSVRTLQRRPFVEMADDPLLFRSELTARANDLAAHPPSYLRMERKAHIEGLVDGANGIEVVLSGDRRFEVDEVIALTGYRPDLATLSELSLEISPVTEGAARLSRALAHLTDCLTVPVLRTEDLESGEPGFYLIGSKSYGRARTFLLQTGLAQLEQIFERL